MSKTRAITKEEIMKEFEDMVECIENDEWYKNRDYIRGIHFAKGWFISSFNNKYKDEEEIKR